MWETKKESRLVSTHFTLSNQKNGIFNYCMRKMTGKQVNMCVWRVEFCINLKLDF